MRRRRSTGTFDINQIIDVAIASLIVQKAPALLNAFLPAGTLVGSMESIAGAGIGFLAGRMFGRSMLSNASIALGITELFGGVIDSFLPSTPPLPPVKGTGDFLRLSGYSNLPVMQTKNSYQQSY